MSRRARSLVVLIGSLTLSAGVLVGHGRPTMAKLARRKAITTASDLPAFSHTACLTLTGIGDQAGDLQRREPPLALVGATVIDGTGTPARSGMTIVISDGRIVDLFASAAKSPPPGAQLVDLTGRFVIPGLIDAHVHLATDPSGEDNRGAQERVLRNALHGGVTTVRDMAGDGRRLADLALAALVDDTESPAIYYAAVMAGPSFFDDPRARLASRGFMPGTAPWALAVTDAPDWPLAIAEAKGTAATGIKVYAAVSASLLRPLVAEAHRQGLKVWSHAAPFPARPTDVVNTGVDVVSHADLLGAELMPPTNDMPRMPDFSQLHADDPRITALLGDPSLTPVDVVKLIRDGSDLSSDGRFRLMNPKRSVELLRTRMR